jgi:hypothetical protein
MAGIKALRKLQFAREATAGVAVPATAIWRGTGVLNSKIEDKDVEEDIGIFGGSDRTVRIDNAGEIELGDIALSPEQLPYLLLMLLGEAALPPVADTGSGFIYSAAIPVRYPGPVPVTFSLEGGDNFEVEGINHVFATSLKIQGKDKEEVTMSASLIGKDVHILPSSFTPDVPIPAVSEVLTRQGRIFIDNEADDFGAGAIVGQIKGFNVTLNAVWHLQYSMDESQSFYTCYYTGHSCEGSVTFLHDAAVSGIDGEKAKWRAKQNRLLRIALNGNQLTTAGAHSHKSIIIDLPIRWKMFNSLSDEDGISIVVGDFVSKYNQAKDFSGSFTVINELASLP